MNIEHLRYVIEVERAGSISQAAENLYMGQPNLSKALKELEGALNIQIFKRTPRGAEVTVKGREFLRYAKSILQQYEEMEALGRETPAEVQSLRVSVPRVSYIVDAFTTFLCGLDAAKPIQMDFLETNALRAIQNVSDGRSDFGIIRCKAEYQAYFLSLLEEKRLDWREVLQFEYYLLMSRKHPLAGEAVVRLDALAPYIQILHGDTALPHMPAGITETERGNTPGDRKIYVYERGSQFDMLARVPGTYMWVSPMPPDLLARNGLVQRRCDSSATFKDLLVYPRGHRFTPLEDAFLRELDPSVESAVHAPG